MKNEFRFPNRHVVCLDGVWDFAWSGDSVPLSSFSPAGISYDEKVAVPGVFDMGIDRYCLRGIGVYRRFVHVEPGEHKFRLKIGGMGLACRIFWDGREIGASGMAYSPVTADFELSGDEPFDGEHELVIAVDNRFEAQEYQFFRDGYDFYAFGGIYRSVELIPLPGDWWLDRVQVLPKNLKKHLVHVRILLGGKIPEEACFRFAFDRCKCDLKDRRGCSVPIHGNVAELDIKVPHCKIWEPESPNMHTLTVIAENGDTIVERFGMRIVEAHDNAIWLNGKKVYLAGANRHETSPQFGPVQSLQQMMDDIRMFKNAGMNFIRCVHYTQSEEWLDLCDENGMLVWVESLGWGLNENDVTMDTASGFLEENRLMIREGINHPSVIIWAMLNECASHVEKSKPVYKLLLEDMKKEDPTRLRSYASCRNIYDVCLDEADVISMNCYPGWFQDITDSVTLASKRIEPHLKEIAAFYSKPEFGNKPILISEMGACGLYGEHDRNLAQWTEEFQADFMKESVRAICENKRISGFALWQFCDSRSYIRGQIRGKPLGYNLAGLVDAYRRPKLAYYAVADYLKSYREKKTKK